MTTHHFPGNPGSGHAQYAPGIGVRLRRFAARIIARRRKNRRQGRWRRRSGIYASGPGNRRWEIAVGDPAFLLIDRAGGHGHSRIVRSPRSRPALEIRDRRNDDLEGETRRCTRAPGLLTAHCGLRMLGTPARSGGPAESADRRSHIADCLSTVAPHWACPQVRRTVVPEASLTQVNLQTRLIPITGENVRRCDAVHVRATFSLAEHRPSGWHVACSVWSEPAAAISIARRFAGTKRRRK